MQPLLENMSDISAASSNALHWIEAIQAWETLYLVTTAFSLVVTWILSVGIYRLFFSPLSNIPGEKLAAATGWVETYHDVFRGGQFIFRIQEWHERYGEIHVPDCHVPDDYVELC